MKKSEPKMILNLSVENSELDAKIKTAMDEYVEDLIIKNLDDTIQRLVVNRVDKLVKGDRWSVNSKINGVCLEDFVRERTNVVIEEIIDKNIKDIFARKVSEMLSK